MKPTTAPLRAKTVSLVIAALFAACGVPLQVESAAQAPDPQPATAEAAATSPTIQEAAGQPAQLVDAADLQPITPENAEQIRQLAQIEPYFPPHTALSADSRVAALGNPWGVRLVERASADEIMAISADMPECQFSGERYMSLSADGGFIALVTRVAVQVWQAGGGLLYEAPYSRRFSTDPGTCGMDMPRLSISHDGRLLAVSGMEYARDSLTQFFRVVDILANEVIYEWDGSRDRMHGSLDAAPGLGFSRDGRYLQTFDPLRFALAGSSPGTAFRFWSADTWEEASPADEGLAKSYSPGELLFARHSADSLEVRSKTGGARAIRLTGAPCSLLYPCQMRFSPDGGQAVLLSTLAGELPFRDALLADRLIRADLRSGELLEGSAGLFRDLEGVLVSDDGGITLAAPAEIPGVPAGAWWMRPDGTDGLRPSPHGALLFTPQVYFLPGDDAGSQSRPCLYCAACRLGETWSAPDCRPGLADDQGGWLTLARDAEGLMLLDARGNTLGELHLPADLADRLPDDYPGGTPGQGLSVRPLGYSREYQTAFYCLELDQRAAGCVIADVGSGTLISEMDAFSHLRFSPDGGTAALFDNRSYQLALLDLESGRLSARSAFQARAYPAPAYFYLDGATVAFLIQDLNDRTGFWLELAAADGSRALGRISLRETGLADPITLGADPDERLWLIGERDGRALLLDFESGAPVHEWQAHAGEMAGLAFAAEGRLLVSMGADGLLRLWGVPR